MDISVRMKYNEREELVGTGNAAVNGLLQLEKGAYFCGKRSGKSRFEA
ncbi:MAG: hypothetical protein ACI4V3_01920 [Faecousia sp.]